jgi:UDP-GlcNAc:undecaprenyl-phosphate GlcNAc-1-phosphate transferase
VAVAIPIVSFGLPILDTGWAILRRLLGRRPLFTGDHEHIHHMMLKRGLSNRQVIIFLYGVCALFGLFSLLFLNPQGKAVGLALFAIGLCIFMGMQHLGYHEVHELTYTFGKAMRQRHTFAKNIHLRREISSMDAVQTFSDLFAAMGRLLESNDFDHVHLKLAGVQKPSGILNPDEVTYDAGVLWQLSHDGQDVTWSWHRLGRQHSQYDPACHWTLHVPLADKQGGLLGEITFHRLMTREPLQLDTYHLCTLLQEELSQTLLRLRLQAGLQPEILKHSQAKATGT